MQFRLGHHPVDFLPGLAGGMGDAYGLEFAGGRLLDPLGQGSDVALKHGRIERAAKPFYKSRIGAYIFRSVLEAGGSGWTV